MFLRCFEIIQIPLQFQAMARVLRVGHYYDHVDETAKTPPTFSTVDHMARAHRETAEDVMQQNYGTLIIAGLVIVVIMCLVKCICCSK